MTIHYRHYRNYDNPGIVALWNSSMQSRGCCRIVKPFFLESQWFCKPWFEPACLSLAIDDTVAPPGNIVGLSLAGSGANTDFTGLDRRKGVISLLLVHLKYRRRKLGTALLQRAEDYLRQQGARDVRFGCTWDRYPFCWGMIGSICPAGVLKSMQEAHSFIATLGYAPAEKFDVLSRSMNQPVPFGDPRFPHLRRKYELRVSPRPTRHWFEEAIHGSIETMVFQLLETAIERPVASVCASEMTQFIEKNEPPLAGLYALEVHPEFRGQGLAKFLIAQTLQHLNDQLFQNVETVIPIENLEARRLFDAMGFTQIDEGISYAKALG